MRESDWRSKLVKSFGSKVHEPKIVWVNDVRYKAGWPDLYTVMHGISTHYELKLSKNFSLPRIEDHMTKLQIAVCKKLSMAEARVFTLINCPVINLVVVYNFRTQLYTEMISHDFDDAWSRGMSLE